MLRAWNKLTVRSRILAGMAVILAGVFAWECADLPIDRLPLRRNIQKLEQELEERRTELAELKAGRKARLDAITRMRRKAQPFWLTETQNPLVQVPTEFTKLARLAQVTVQRPGDPRKTKVLDMTHVSQIEFSVRATASMREISRLLAEVEQSQHKFYWGVCQIRPDNRRTPQQAVMTGRIRALVLSPEASKFISGDSEGDGNG